MRAKDNKIQWDRALVKEKLQRGERKNYEI